MATIIENESAWSTTASTNANVDTGINWAENQDAASVNNSARGQMAARAKARLDQGGALAAAGSGNALTVTTNQVLSAAHLAAGQRLAVRATAANTISAVTFAPDGLTAAPVKKGDGSALAIGSIRLGTMLDLVYNASSSEWRAMNILPMSVIRVQTFLATGTYTPAAGLTYAVIECVGGGGGGGGTAASGASQTNSAGGGGGGGYSRKVVTVANIGVSQVVTVGDGGAGGAAGNNNGVAGTDTSVGTLCVGKGGALGTGSAAGSGGQGGAGGVAGTGDFSIPGGQGSFGAGSGASSPQIPGGGGGMAGGGFGAGAVMLSASFPGNPGGNYGGGGGGGYSRLGAAAQAGGAGAPGIVIITEFC
jgi:hypothetical protein